VKSLEVEMEIYSVPFIILKIDNLIVNFNRKENCPVLKNTVYKT